MIQKPVNTTQVRQIKQEQNKPRQLAPNVQQIPNRGIIPQEIKRQGVQGMAKQGPQMQRNIGAQNQGQQQRRIVQVNRNQPVPKPQENKNIQNQQNIIQVQKQPQQQRNIPQSTIAPNIVITQKNDFASQPRRIVLKSNPQTNQKMAANRRVVLKSTNTNQPVEDAKEENLGSFLSNRKVVEASKSVTTGIVGTSLVQGTLIKTPVVTVSNLAAGTTDVKLRKLCQGLGPIKVSLMFSCSDNR